MNCDCRLRPLRRWLLDDYSRINQWSEVSCSFPTVLSGQKLLQLDEEEMQCTGEGVRENEDYDTTPDVKFREIHR